MDSLNLSLPVSLRRFSRRQTAAATGAFGIHLHVVDPQTPPVLAMRDLSLGGFVLETIDAVVLGVRRRFLFMTAEGLRITLWATAASARPADATGSRYASEWRFTDDSFAGVEVLFRSMTSELGRRR